MYIWIHGMETWADILQVQQWQIYDILKYTWQRPRQDGGGGQEK